MANIKKRRTGLYRELKKNTSVDICLNNLIIFTINEDIKNINYVVTKKNAKLFILKIEDFINTLSKEDCFTYKDISEILKDDIYKVYKTKVSQINLTIALLNFLVKEEYLYSDDSYTYKAYKKKVSIEDIFNKYGI